MINKNFEFIDVKRYQENVIETIRATSPANKNQKNWL
jgi:hypothetical protein